MDQASGLSAECKTHNSELKEEFVTEERYKARLANYGVR